jgi:glycosyltransferase involved in cell wall biosynthesis
LRFLASSRGELGIAKSGYIVSRGGWISDRSLMYLALGRPVVLHDTGWPRSVGTSGGMVAFAGVDDCAARIREIESDYDACSRAALGLAETCFVPARALRPVLDRL